METAYWSLACQNIHTRPLRELKGGGWEGTHVHTAVCLYAVTGCSAKVYPTPVSFTINTLSGVLNLNLIVVLSVK